MNKISVETIVNAPIEKVWELYNNPHDIEQWNTASPDWETINAKSDLRIGAEFSSRMQAKDGSMGFDFIGVYTQIIPLQLIEYCFGDRHAKVEFSSAAHGVKVRVEFDPETVYPEEHQRQGWQAILDNFAAYAEQNAQR